jgi:hypothetical protein
MDLAYWLPPFFILMSAVLMAFVSWNKEEHPVFSSQTINARSSNKLID